MRALYQQTRGGLVELRAIPNDRASTFKPKRTFVATATQVIDFIEKHGQKGSPYSVYFGVNKREREAGKKDDIERACALYVDIDTVKNGWDTNEFIKRVHSMKGVLRPSACVMSGGGLHLYWFINTVPLVDQKNLGAVELVNVELRNLFGGDAVQNVDRILRLPGSYNNRAKAKVELKWCYAFDRFDINDVMKAAQAFPMCIGDDGRWIDKKKQAKLDAQREETDPMDAFVNAYTSGKRRMDLNMEKMWRDRVRYRAPRGKIGIHEAALIHTAHLYIASKGSTIAYPETQVVRQVMDWIKFVKDRDAPEEAWDFKKEEQTVLDMYRTWRPKWDQYDRDRRREQAAERKEKNGCANDVRERRRGRAERAD